ncbi:MAG: ABC transporter substrate-binding protein [Candidatus Limnocylindrales bacterium]
MDSLLRGAVPRGAALVAAAALIFGGCSSGATTAPASTAPESMAAGSPAAASFGAPESATITVVVPYNQVQTYGPFYVGVEQGYYAAEGLTVKVINASDVRGAVVGSSADIGMDFVGNVTQAVSSGLGVSVVSGANCRTPFTFAVGSTINSVTDLDGKDVLLSATAGDPQNVQRKAFLAAAGWDLSQATPNYVNIPGGSAAWASLFAQGKLSMVPVYDATRGTVLNAGGKFILDVLKDIPSYVLFGRNDWISANPNTLARFLQATIKGFTYYDDLANTQAILTMMSTKYGFKIDSYESSPAKYKIVQEPNCNNLYFDQAAFEAAQKAQSLPNVDFSKLANLTALEAAQASLGLDNTLPAAPPFP